MMNLQQQQQLHCMVKKTNTFREKYRFDLFLQGKARKKARIYGEMNAENIQIFLDEYIRLICLQQIPKNIPMELIEIIIRFVNINSKELSISSIRNAKEQIFLSWYLKLPKR